ncbi:MAG: hypothetical protein LUD29_05945 [Clostridia bacterium]|nr:hypothetical protein [Clostridia bacterium]
MNKRYLCTIVSVIIFFVAMVFGVMLLCRRDGAASASASVVTCGAESGVGDYDSYFTEEEDYIYKLTKDLILDSGAPLYFSLETAIYYLDGHTITGDVRISGDGVTVCLDGGKIAGDVYMSGTATKLDLGGGTLEGRLVVYSDVAKLDLDGGTVTGDIYVGAYYDAVRSLSIGDSTDKKNVMGTGVVKGKITVGDASTLKVSEGTFEIFDETVFKGISFSRNWRNGPFLYVREGASSVTVTNVNLESIAETKVVDEGAAYNDGGDVTYYFECFIDAYVYSCVDADGKMTILTNVSVEISLAVFTETEIDLSGHTLSADIVMDLDIYPKATLKISDSSSEESGKIKGRITLAGTTFDRINEPEGSDSKTSEDALKITDDTLFIVYSAIDGEGEFVVDASGLFSIIDAELRYRLEPKYDDGSVILGYVLVPYYEHTYQLVWTLTSGGTSVSAMLRCSGCGEYYVDLEGKVATFQGRVLGVEYHEETGIAEYFVSVEIEGVTYTDTIETEPAVSVTKTEDVCLYFTDFAEAASSAEGGDRMVVLRDIEYGMAKKLDAENVSVEFKVDLDIDLNCHKLYVNLSISSCVSMDINGGEYFGCVTVENCGALYISDDGFGSVSGTIRVEEGGEFEMRGNDLAPGGSLTVSLASGFVFVAYADESGEKYYSVMSEAEHEERGHGYDYLTDVELDAAGSRLTFVFKCLCGEDCRELVELVYGVNYDTAVGDTGWKNDEREVTVNFDVDEEFKAPNGVMVYVRYAESLALEEGIILAKRGESEEEYNGGVYILTRISVADCDSEGEDVYRYGSESGIEIHVHSDIYHDGMFLYATLDDKTWVYFCPTCGKYYLESRTLPSSEGYTRVEEDVPESDTNLTVAIIILAICDGLLLILAIALVVIRRKREKGADDEKKTAKAFGAALLLAVVPRGGVATVIVLSVLAAALLVFDIIYFVKVASLGKDGDDAGDDKPSDANGDKTEKKV